MRRYANHENRGNAVFRFRSRLSPNFTQEDTTLRQTLSRGVFAAAAAATGILSLSGTSAFADSTANGTSSDSPGVLSGNTVQAPVEVEANVCGNTVNGVAALNSSFGNTCENGPETTPPAKTTPTTPPPRAETPQPAPPVRYTPPVVKPHEPPQLAQTGDKETLAAGALSVALIAGGAMLYRRGRAAGHR
ncbi:chaplin family protein [Streptomyces sp. SID10815]|uniref:chaplin family protein n=1 Tax=Streptomyces sp. SID10815 TaxID=2706027 RepID=UPI001EF31DD8|nr:chaplin family protein [Streptomyces sp. SID10815]